MMNRRVRLLSFGYADHRVMPGLIAAGMLALSACGGGGFQNSQNVAQNPTTPPANPQPPPTETPPPAAPPPPAPPPPPGQTQVAITSPGEGDSIASPAPFAFAIQNAPASYDHMKLLADGNSVFYTGQQSLKDGFVFLPAGPHAIELDAYDSNGDVLGKTQMNLNVTGAANPPGVPQIQNFLGWTWCTAALDGGPCASGLGNADSNKFNNVAVPSLSGSSAMFTLAGPTGYSNALWWYSLGGGVPLNHLTYEMDFFIDDASLPEALEFDVNQSYAGVRYTWGTECNYRDTGKWDVWDPNREAWVTTQVPCPQVTSKQWHHLKWEFDRINGQVHYISVTVDNTTTPVDIYLDPQLNWTRGEDIDVAFQMDGDFHQDPYTVWLDNVTLTGTY
jgi:hypothetical protein